VDFNSDMDCGVQPVLVDGISVSSRTADFIQFRLSQLEHGGGSCNCWGLSNFTMNVPGSGAAPSATEHIADIVPINLTVFCDKKPNPIPDMPEPVVCANDLFEGSEVGLCGGSASVPRGIVTALYQRNRDANIVPCDLDDFDGVSAVIDPVPQPLTELLNCSNVFPNL